MASDCESDKKLKFCTVNGVFMLGDNTTDYQNGLITFDDYPDTIIIPRKIGKKEVKEIGQYSLAHCYLLKKK